MSDEKTSGPTPGKTTPVELIPQKHGGALKRGPGGTNAGGTGRPASEIRARLRGSFDERITVLEEFADGVTRIRLLATCEHCGKEPSKPVSADELFEAIPKAADRIRAIDTLAKYGLGTTQEITVENVRDKLGQTLRIIREELGEEEAVRVLARIRPVWG